MLRWWYSNPESQKDKSVQFRDLCIMMSNTAAFTHHTYYKPCFRHKQLSRDGYWYCYAALSHADTLKVSCHYFTLRFSQIIYFLEKRTLVETTMLLRYYYTLILPIIEHSSPVWRSTAVTISYTGASGTSWNQTLFRSEFRPSIPPWTLTTTRVYWLTGELRRKQVLLMTSPRETAHK